MALFLGEVQAILGAYPHLEAVLYYVDAACYGLYELSIAAELPQPKGGGGTDFRPFFHAIEKTFSHPYDGVCVYLTDGYGTFPTKPLSLPTLWVLSPGGISVESTVWRSGSPDTRSLIFTVYTSPTTEQRGTPLLQR